MKRQEKNPDNEEAEPFAMSHAWLPALFLVAVTLLAYGPVWHAGFIWDDDVYLTDSPAIKSADGLYRIWFATSTPDYYPLLFSMWWLEWRIWANHPLGYHLVNVLLHACSAVLLWRVLQRLKIPGALLAAAIFALHPVNVESVAWIAERKNTLCMFFYAGTLLFWLKFEDSGRGRWYGLALAGFALALLSKTVVAPLPVVLLGLAWWRRGRVGWKDVRQVAPFFVIAAALSLLTVWYEHHQTMNHEIARTDGFWTRLAMAGRAVWFYLYKAALPLDLASVYPRWETDAPNVLTYIPLVLLAAAFVLCWRSGRGWGRALFFGLAYFVVMLLPLLGFINTDFMRISLVADRWQYFAIIGPIALAAGIIIRRPVLAAALLLALGALTWRQCGIYANAETLWANTVRLVPDCWMGRFNLGNCLAQRGRMDEAISQYQKALEIRPDLADARLNLGNCFFQLGRIEEAISQYQKTLEIKPGTADAHLNLGNCFSQLGRIEEAISQYHKALDIMPDNAKAQNSLGLVLSGQGKRDEAILHLLAAIKSKPQYDQPYYNLGLIYLQQSRLDDAIAQFRSAIRINPQYDKAFANLGIALAKQSHLDEAIGQYRQALAIAPNNAYARYALGRALETGNKLAEAAACYSAAIAFKPDFAEARENLRAVLIRLGSFAQPIYNPGNTPEAIRLATQATQLAPDDPSVWDAKAAVLAESGQYGEAVAAATKALGLAAAQQKDLAQKIQARLQLYQAGAPFHEPVHK
jgi:protein O-mannosyl-transferase